MDYSIAYFAPSESLRHFVAFHYTFGTTGRPYSAGLGALLGQANWLLRGNVLYHFCDGTAMAVPSVAIIGPTNGNLSFETAGHVALVGSSFLPAGWAALARVGASEFSDRLADGGALWGRRAAALLEPLAEARSDRDRVLLVDSFLLGEMERRPTLVGPCVAAINAWLAGPDLTLGRLMDSIDVSQRQATRIALAAHGAPLKVLARKYRALRSAAAFACGEAISPGDMANGDFYDQSHFIREFRHFLGMTPSAYLNDAAGVARVLMYRRWQAGARHPFAIWS